MKMHGLLLLFCLFAGTGCRSSLSEMWSSAANQTPAPQLDAAQPHRSSTTKLSREDSIAQNLARAHGEFSLGKISAARQMYRKVLADDPGHPVAHHRLAILADREQNFTLAEAHYLASLNREPRNADVLSDLGYSYFQQGRREEAALRLTEALKHEPTNLHALKNMAAVEEARGNRKGVAELQRQIAEIPQRPAGPLAASRLSGGKSRPMSNSSEPLHAPDPLVAAAQDANTRQGELANEDEPEVTRGDVSDPTRQLKQLMEQKRREALALRQRRSRQVQVEEQALRDRRLREIQLTGGERGGEVAHAGGTDLENLGGPDHEDRRRPASAAPRDNRAADRSMSALRRTPDHKLRDVLAEIDHEGEESGPSLAERPSVITVDPFRGRGGSSSNRSSRGRSRAESYASNLAVSSRDSVARSHNSRDGKHPSNPASDSTDAQGTIRASYGPQTQIASNRPWNDRGHQVKSAEESYEEHDSMRPQLGRAYEEIPESLEAENPGRGVMVKHTTGSHAGEHGRYGRDARRIERDANLYGGPYSGRLPARTDVWPAEVPESLHPGATGRLDAPVTTNPAYNGPASAAARAALIGGMNAGPGGMFPMPGPRGSETEGRSNGRPGVPNSAMRPKYDPRIDYANGGPAPQHSPGEGTFQNGTAYPQPGRYDNEGAIREWHEAQGAPADPVGRPSRYARDPAVSNQPWNANVPTAAASTAAGRMTRDREDEGYRRQRMEQDRALRDQQRALYGDRQLPPGNGELLPASGNYVNPADYDHRMINNRSGRLPHDLRGQEGQDEGRGAAHSTGDRWNNTFAGAPQSVDQVRREGQILGTPYRQSYWNERSDAGPIGHRGVPFNSPGEGPVASQLDAPRVRSRY